MQVASGSTDQLAHRAQQGLPGAMQALLHQYRPLVRAEATKFIGTTPLHTREDLEAIGNSVLFKLVARWDAGRGSYSALAKTAVRNSMLNEQARMSRPSRWSGQPDVLLDEEESGGVDPAALALDRLHGEQVSAAAGALVEDPVDVAILAGIQSGATLVELAKRTGLTPQGCSYRRGRLLERLREQLAHLAP
jgi:hypothetical protein